MADTEKVSIIIPPSPFLADERVFPFLGPLKVAAQLKKESYPIDILDLSGIGNFENVVETYTRDQGKETNTFGITATTPQFPHAVKIATKIRSEKPDARIIFGGPHATLVGTAYHLDKAKKVDGRGTQAFKQLVDTFDSTVIGDGELAILEALQRNNLPAIIDAGSRN